MKNLANLTVSASKMTKCTLYKVAAISLSLLALGSSVAHAAIESCPKPETIRFDEAKSQWVTTDSGWAGSHYEPGPYRIPPPNSESSVSPYPFFQKLSENNYVECQYKRNDQSIGGYLNFIKNQDSANAEPSSFRLSPKEGWTWQKLYQVHTLVYEGYICNESVCKFEVNYTPKNPVSHLRSPF